MDKSIIPQIVYYKTEIIDSEMAGWKQSVGVVTEREEES